MANPQTTSEDKNVFVTRRTKEILGIGGYDWSMFSGEEKLIAVMQAEREWYDKHFGEPNAA